MPHQQTLNCRTCGTPLRMPELKPGLLFPEDYGAVIAFLGARFNAIECPLCHTFTGVSFPLAVVDNARNAALLCAPDGSGAEEVLMQAAEGYALTICRSYVELYNALVAWVNEHVFPRSRALLSGEFGELTRQEQIELFTPLFLRVLLGQAEGQFTVTAEGGGDADQEQLVRVLRDVYAPLVHNQLRLVMLEACRTRTLLELPAAIRERVPVECLTPEVLERVAGGCPAPPGPEEGPEAFANGFREEYLNAVAHSYAGAPNPRGLAWASYLRNVWLLSRMERVFIDPQMLLTPELSRSVARFEDLWDVSVPQALKDQNVPEEMKDVGQMMEHYGFIEQYADALKAGPVRFYAREPGDADALKRVRKVMKERILSAKQFNESPEQSAEYGEMVGIMTGTLLANVSAEEGLAFVEEMAEEAAAAGDAVAAISAAAHAVEQLNKVEMYKEARAIISGVLEEASDPRLSAPLSLLIYFWNEFGNVLRYMYQNEKAMEVYDHVGKLIESSPEGERKQGNRATLLRNRAIVYRQMGKYGKSISLLLAEAKSRPEDDSLQHTLAVLYLKINRYAEALNYIEKALSSRAARIDRRLQASYLVTRAMVRWRLGDAEEGVADLMHASDILPPTSATLTRRIACAALEFYPASGAARAFVEKCKAQLAEALREEDFRFDPSQRITFLFQLGKRLVREGDARDAQDLLERERRWLDDDGVDFPWQLYHLRGLIAYGLGEYEETWGHLKAALERLERDVPVAEDAAFATFWMQDKEYFQMELASVCLDLFDRGHLGTAELLGVYEFMNGKEISARVERRGEAAATPVSERLAAAVRAGAGSKAFVFFEAGEKIAVLCVPLDGGRAEFVEGLTLSTTEVVRVRRLTQAAFKTANPADLSRLDAQLAPWRALGARLGESLAPYLSGCERVCFLPGRAFTGLPLHLLQLPGGAPLLERMPVVYAPNFSVLLAATRRADARDARAGTVVTVMKRTEPRHFVERAYSVSDRLVALLGGRGAARWLKGAEADHESVRAALAVSSEAVFICHGTTAGPEKGYGICIADGGDLPPSLLPVSELPELGRFILTWQDIDGLARSPELFVSVACSTGVTEVAGGGVRFGLEQSLFGTGTRQIVSPLWDVEQESALRWLEHFFGARAAHPEWAVDEAFRHAGLSLSREFNHPYFWGAFILNGSAMPEVR